MGEALHNLLYSTAGNVVGGVLLVGLPFTYLNPREREEQLQDGFLVREVPRA
jgi:formate/nitrite transporter FocA (FNT family)